MQRQFSGETTIFPTNGTETIGRPYEKTHEAFQLHHSLNQKLTNIDHRDKWGN